MPSPFPQSNLRRSPLLALVGALFMTIGLFLIIPFTQVIQGVPAETVNYRKVLVMPPPPEPPVIEEEAQIEDVREPLTELQNDPPAMELNQLEVSLNPGVGEALSMGVQSMSFDLEVDVVAAIKEIFDFDDLKTPPTLTNARQIHLKFPPDLVRRGVKEVKVVVEILIDQSGRTRPVKIVSSSYADPKVDQEAMRAVRQARFTVTQIDGRAVQVRARFPLTLRAPR
jgi:TonB family protein